MMSTSELQEQREIHSILEELFTSLVNGESIDEEGKFNLNYRGDDDVGKWIAGRNDSSNGLDYVYRQRFNHEQTEPDKIYLYSNDFGWSNIGVLVGERDIILGLAEWVNTYVHNIKKDYESELENAFDNIETERRKFRENLSLQDIINAINSYNFDFLRDFVAPEGEDAVEFWKLLYSYDSDGEIVDNDVSIEYIDENIFFARSVRQYINGDEKKIYPMGLVIGYDDTPDSFFVHRIERDDDLDNSKFTWKLTDIRNKMGFDIDYMDLDTNKIPLNCRTRLQGNLCIIPHNYESEKNLYFNEVVHELKKYSYRMYNDLYYMKELNINEDIIYGPDSLLYHSGPELSILNKPSTDELKEFQRALKITEDEIREEQNIRNIKRLSANLRGEIITDIHLDKFCDWLFEDCSIEMRQNYLNSNAKFGRGFPKKYISSRFSVKDRCNELREIALNNESEIQRSTIHKLAEEESDDIFNPNEQCNIILGNHSVILGAGRIHPSPTSVNRLNNLELEKIIVPQKTTVMLGHDEHKARIYTFPKGVYEFRFLEGLNTNLFN